MRTFVSVAWLEGGRDGCSGHGFSFVILSDSFCFRCHLLLCLVVSFRTLYWLPFVLGVIVVWLILSVSLAALSSFVASSLVSPAVFVIIGSIIHDDEYISLI